MKILVTGAGGFVGKNLCARLQNIRDGKDRTTPLTGEVEVLPYDITIPGCDKAMLESYLCEADFIFHLAGVNRPKDVSEFQSGNGAFTEDLTETLLRLGKATPLMLSSSIQAELDNPYGVSKREAEYAVRTYGERSGARVLIYRFPNLFGKWCRPNYNSVVATFCYNTANGLPIQVNDPTKELKMLYIDDLVDEMLAALQGKEQRGDDGFCYAAPVHEVTLGQIAELVQSFPASRETLATPDMGDPFARKLYATYLSYLPDGGASYPLTAHTDARGSFTEFLRSPERGQVSINCQHPGIIKGNHWHDTKNEKFLVVSGKAVIRLRKIGTDKVDSYFVDGENPTVVDIPTGFTHNIENIGESELVTVMWASECFDPNKPDTFFEEV